MAAKKPIEDKIDRKISEDTELYAAYARGKDVQQETDGKKLAEAQDTITILTAKVATLSEQIASAERDAGKREKKKNENKFWLIGSTITFFALFSFLLLISDEYPKITTLLAFASTVLAYLIGVFLSKFLSTGVSSAIFVILFCGVLWAGGFVTIEKILAILESNL